MLYAVCNGGIIRHTLVDINAVYPRLIAGVLIGILQYNINSCLLGVDNKFTVLRYRLHILQPVVLGYTVHLDGIHLETIRNPEAYTKGFIKGNCFTIAHK